MEGTQELETFLHLAAAQHSLCVRHKTELLACAPESKIGLATASIGQRPIQGLRHRPSGDACGWFIWCGEYSPVDDFFQPLHARHLVEKLPSVIQFLGLPPGFRFITDGAYLDVWYDSALLEV